MEDSFAGARDEAAMCCGTLMKMVGERPLNPVMDGMADVRKAKVKEAFEKATVKCKAGGGPPKPPPAAAPAAAPKKKAKPSPPQPSAKSTVEPKARPTRASAAAASKKITHDAEELNKSTQESSSPNGEAHGSSSTAVEGEAFLCSCVLSCLLSCRSSCT